MRRQTVFVGPDCFDVIVNVWIDVWAALFGVHPTLHNVLEMWDHAACDEALPLIIEIEAPRI